MMSLFSLALSGSEHFRPLLAATRHTKRHLQNVATIFKVYNQRIRLLGESLHAQAFLKQVLFRGSWSQPMRVESIGSEAPLRDPGSTAGATVSTRSFFWTQTESHGTKGKGLPVAQMVSSHSSLSTLPQTGLQQLHHRLYYKGDATDIGNGVSSPWSRKYGSWATWVLRDLARPEQTVPKATVGVPQELRCSRSTSKVQWQGEAGKMELRRAAFGLQCLRSIALVGN